MRRIQAVYKGWKRKKKVNATDGKIDCCGPVAMVAFKTLLYILFWYTFSIGLTFYNKWLFHWHGFNHPLTVTVVHMACTFGWAAVGRKVVSKRYNVENAVVSYQDIFYKVGPSGAAAALDIGMSNLALATGLHINIYTICKSTVLIFTLLFAVIFRIQRATWKIVVVIVLVVGGLVVFQAKGSGEGGPIPGGGFLLVMVASVMGGLRWVLTQVLMEQGGLRFSGTVDTLYYVAPCMAITLLPFAVGIEGKALLEEPLLFKAETSSIVLGTLGYVFGGAFIAFMLTFSEFLLVSFAGSVTLSIAGIAKELVTVGIAAMFVKGNELSGINVVGLMVSVSGIAYYNYIKYEESTSTAATTVYELVSGQESIELEETELSHEAFDELSAFLSSYSGVFLRSKMALDSTRTSLPSVLAFHVSCQLLRL
jgi:solute carrier family 35, member C2